MATYQLPAGYSRSRLTRLDALLNPKGQIVGFFDEDGSLADLPVYALNPDGSVAGIAGADGGGVLAGPAISGAWFKTPSIFRLRFTGTGTATLDSRDSLGNITVGVNSYTLSGAVDQIEFPYAGDNAVNIRVTMTGNVTCEVI